MGRYPHLRRSVYLAPAYVITLFENYYNRKQYKLEMHIV